MKTAGREREEGNGLGDTERESVRRCKKNEYDGAVLVNDEPTHPLTYDACEADKGYGESFGE